MHSLTNTGERFADFGDGVSNGAIARKATAIRLYTSASVPVKTGAEGVAFIQLGNGNGYLTGGKAISVADWTGSVVSTNWGMTLATQTWTASGAGLVNVAGCYLVDAANVVLAWWERTAVTVPSGETFAATALRIELRTGTP